jgi:hypothetical protein
VLLRLFSILSIAFFWLNISFAQSFTIKGTIIAPGQEQSPTIIKVFVKDSTGLIKKFAFAKDNGEFFIELNKDTCTYQLQISKVGFCNTGFFIKPPHNNIDTTLQLFTCANDLPEVHVKASPVLTKKGDTTAYKVAAFAQGNEQSLGDLLQKLPGLQVNDNGTVSFNGKTINKILLENDDLTGSNYNTLTKNLGISGIDKIEVIENYKDNTLLENKVNTGNETVLNLNFKQKKIKVFGNVNAGHSLQHNFYELKNNSTGLFKKHKFILTNNFNSISNTAVNLLGQTGNLSFLDNSHVQNLTTNTWLKTFVPVSFTDMQPLQIPVTRLFNNNTQLHTLNYLYKPNTASWFKTTLYTASDIYSQSNSLQQTFNTPPNFFTFLANNTIHKNNKYVAANATGAVSFKNNYQLIVSYHGQQLQYAQQKTGNLFLIPTAENNTATLQQHAVLLSLVKLFKNKALLTIGGNYTQQQIKQDYLVPHYMQDSIFLTANSFSDIIQQYRQPAKAFTVYAKYSKKIMGLDFSLKQSFDNSSITVNPNTFAFNDSSIAFINPSFNTHNKFNIHKWQTILQISKTIKYKLTIAGSITWENNNINQQINALTNANKANFLLPQLSVQYKFSDNKLLMANANWQPSLPTIQQLTPNYLLTGFNTIFAGSNSVNTGTNYTVSLGYLYFDLIGRGIIFNAFVLKSNVAPNYLTNFTINNLYVFNTLQGFNKHHQFNTMQMRFEKFFAKKKFSAGIQPNVSNFKVYQFSEKVLATIDGLNFNVELFGKTNWQKWFNVQSSFNFMYLQQHTSTNNTNSVRNNIANYLFKNSIVIKPNKKIMVNVTVDYYANKPEHLKYRDIVFTDVQGSYVINEKLAFTLLCKNIFNKTVFNIKEISATQTQDYSLNLQNRFLLATIAFKF